MVAMAAVGAVLGDSVSYSIGRWGGRGAVRRFAAVRKRLEPKLDRAEQFFDRHGGPAVFLGRWTAALRGIVPAAAGMSGMPYRRFLAWNLFTSGVWATATVTGGYLVGRHLSAVFDKIGWVVLAVVTAGAAAWLLRRHAATGCPSKRRG